MEIVGNGTIYEVKPGKVYRLRHCIGKDPVTGKYLKSPCKTVYCTKRQARDELAKYKQELIEQDELSRHPEKAPVPTVREYAERHLRLRATNKKLSENTLAHDRSDFAHVVKLFGDFPLDELTADIINARCSAYRLAEGKSLNVLNRITKSLKTLYRRAVMDGLIEYRLNPCLGIDIDKPEPSDRRSLTENEFKRLAAVVDSKTMEARVVAVKIGMATGMRKGEVLGLTWKSVDLDSCKISITQQYTQDRSLKGPKSRAGKRILSIDEGSARYLARWKKIQMVDLEMHGVRQSADTPVVSTSLGGYCDPRDFSKWFRDFCVENGFGTYKIIEEYRDGQGKYGGWRRTRQKGYEGLCFHELRHTQATLLIGSRCDIKTVQHRLGHADVQTTLNIYSHVIDANDEAAAETIAALQA